MIFARLIEIETQQNMSRDDVLRVAESIYDVAHKSVVRLILKQKQTQPELAMVHCVRREMVMQRLAELEQMKYTLGITTILCRYFVFILCFLIILFKVYLHVKSIKFK